MWTGTWTDELPTDDELFGGIQPADLKVFSQVIADMKFLKQKAAKWEDLEHPSMPGVSMETFIGMLNIGMLKAVDLPVPDSLLKMKEALNGN